MFEILRGTLVSWMDITKPGQSPLKKKWKPRWIYIKRRWKTSCVDQKTKFLRKELAKKIHETQMDLHAIRTSLDARTNNLLETITHNRHKGAPSRRDRPHDPGQDTNDEDPIDNTRRRLEARVLPKNGNRRRFGADP
jgi:hypothetical protein